MVKPRYLNGVSLYIFAQDLFKQLGFDFRGFAVRYFVVMNFVVCVELIGLSAVFYLIAPSSSLASVKDSDFMGLRDLVNTETTSVLVMFFVSIWIVRSIAIYYATRFLSIQHINVRDRLRYALMARYVVNNAEWNIPTADIVNMVLRRSEWVSLTMIPSLIRIPSTMLMVFILSLYAIDFSFLVALIFFGVSFLGFVLNRLHVGKRLERYVYIENEVYNHQISLIEALCKNISFLNVVERPSIFFKKFEDCSNRLNKVSNKKITIELLTRPLLELLLPFQILIGLWLVDFDWVQVVGVGVVFLRLGPLLISLMRDLNILNMGTSHVEDISKIFEKKAEWKSHNCGLTEVNARDGRVSRIDRVVVQGLSYKFPHDLSWTLDDLTASFEIGRLNVIAGRSGAGKTTLLKILSGSLEAKKGSVVYQAGARHLAPTDVSVGWVSQETFLFPGTVESNMSCFQSIQRQDLLEICDALDLDASIIDRQIVDGGTNLSGGQKQRISVARAIYANNPVICMDEPTASLDIETRDSFLRSLEPLKNQALLVIVSHDPGVINAADYVLELE